MAQESPSPAPPPRRNDRSSAAGNGLAVTGLVFAFLVPLLGLILSSISWKRSNKANGAGSGIALAGLIISSVFTLISLVLIVPIVLIAVPVLQQNFRDDARTTDLIFIELTVEVVEDREFSEDPVSKEDAKDAMVEALADLNLGFYDNSEIGTDLKEEQEIYVVTDEQVAAIDQILPTNDQVYVVIGATCQEAWPEAGTQSSVLTLSDDSDGDSDVSEEQGEMTGEETSVMPISLFYNSEGGSSLLDKPVSWYDDSVYCFNVVE